MPDIMNKLYKLREVLMSWFDVFQMLVVFLAQALLTVCIVIGVLMVISTYQWALSITYLGTLALLFYATICVLKSTLYSKL